MIELDGIAGRRWTVRLARMRAGQMLGLLFLIGPLADLVSGPRSPGRVATIAIVVVVFALLYVALLPPIPPLARRGMPAVAVSLALLAALAALTLALGAPHSFVLLFFYVLAAAAMALPTAWAVVVIGVGAIVVAASLAATGSNGSSVAAYTLTTLAVGSIVAALGSTTRANQELRDAREGLARLAVSEERLRIARDLHDLLGHTLSLIALKSELAAKLVEHDPQRAQMELVDVQSVTRQALTEIRGAVHGYRRLALVDAVDGARAALAAAGIDCRFDSSVPEVQEDVESVLAWAVREATTNVVRHSGARACAITLTTEAGAVALQVDDDGRSAAGTVSADGAGLAGLAERARRLDGTLAAAPRPGGGFRLRLTLPLEGT
jgi:two-component system, NarL family, sensor histidine kinase DesK